MSSAQIVREVERETAIELDELLSSADERAAAIIESAKAAVRARVEGAIAQAEPAARAEAGRRVNAARSRINQRGVELTLARTAAVHAAASARLEAIADGAEGERWPLALGRLTGEALGFAGPGARVRVRRCDAGVARALVDEYAGSLELVDDASAGVLARSADGRIEVDATIQVRLDRARVRLAETVAARLGLGG